MKDDIAKIVDTIEKLRECIRETKARLCEEESLESYWCDRLRSIGTEEVK